MSVIGKLLKGANDAQDSQPATLANSQIRADGGTQMRESLNPTTVAEYVAAWQDGAQFPAVVVFDDGDGNHWLADGFHRLASHITAFGPGESIAVDMRDGTQREAILYAASANADHGLRRTNQDKLRSVKTLLGDAEWSQYSDNHIAKLCAVSQPFVSTQRKQLEAAGEISKSMIRKTASGATMNTERIGNAPRETQPKPERTYNDYKPTPTAPVYVAPVAPVVEDAPTVNQAVEFECGPAAATYNEYKPGEARAMPHGALLVELHVDVIGELITIIDQNGLGFLMRKSSVAALRAALVEVLE